MSVKAIGIGLFVVAAIGAKVWFGIPRWRTGVEQSTEIPREQAFMQQLTTRKETKVRLSYTASSPIDCYFVSPQDHLALQSGRIDEQLIQRINNRAIVRNAASATAVEFSLPQGETWIYFEPPTDEDAKAAKSVNVSYTIEEYR